MGKTVRSLATLSALLWLAFGAAAPAFAQGCGPQNPNCIVPTAPPGTNNNQAASTAFVENAISGLPTGLANPTASVGLSAINGSATTAMRSDAAPPLSSAIQSALTGTNHAVAVGTGAFGFRSVGPCLNTQLLAWPSGVGADPACTLPSAIPGIGTPPLINLADKPYNIVCDDATVNTGANITAAYVAAAASKQGIWVPGRCRYSGTITNPGGVDTYGAGTAVSALAGVSATQEMNTVTGTAAVGYYNLSISNVVPMTGGWGIKFTPPALSMNSNSRFGNVDFIFMMTALDATNAAYWKMDVTTFQLGSANGTDIIVNNTIAGSDAGDNAITNSLFSDGTLTRTFISWKGGGGLYPNNNKFLGGAKAVYNQALSNFGIFAFNNNSVDGVAIAGVQFRPMAGFTTGECTINSNVWTGAPTNGHILMDGGDGGSIVRCAMGLNTFRQDGASQSISLLTGTNYTIGPNNHKGTGLAVGVDLSVTNSTIISGNLGGMTISSPLPATVVSCNTESGAVPKLRCNNQLEIGGLLVLDGSTSGFGTLAFPAVAGASGITFPLGTTTFSSTGPGVVQQAALGAAFTVGTVGIPFGGTGQVTASAAFNALSPMTTAGDIIYGGVAGAGTRLAAGTANQLLHSGSPPSWSAVVSADMNITTTSCTNQFVTAISAGGVGTCTTDTLASAQHANQGTTTTVLHGNAAGNPSFAAVSLTADVSGTLPVANGGTGLTSGTSGGILAYTASGTLASSAALAANAIVVGGGAGVVPLTPATTPPTISSTGVLAVPNATDMTALGTASAVFSGGVSIAKQAIVGTNFGVGIVPTSNGGQVTAQVKVAAGINLAVRTQVAAAGAVLFSAINDDQSSNIPMEFRSTGFFFTNGINSDVATTDTSLCFQGTGRVAFGSGALGVCLGTSGRQFKTAFAPMTAGIDDLMKIDMQNYRYREGYGDGGKRLMYGPMAQDVEAALPDLAGHNAAGETINYDSGSLFFVGLRAIQQLKGANDNFEARLQALEQKAR